MPKLSIITVVRNAVEEIGPTIESVIGQTFDNYEYIVIDGASTDGTQKVIERYRKDIDVYVSEPDTGLYNALNKGAKLAKGEYIIYVHAGDYLMQSDVIERVFSSNPTADIIYGDLYLFDHNGGFPYVKSFSGIQMNTWYLLDSYLPHPSSFTKRSLFEKYGYFDEKTKIVGDYDFFLRVINKYKASTQYVPVVVTAHKMDGRSTNANNQQLADEIDRNKARDKIATIDLHWKERQMAIRANVSGPILWMWLLLRKFKVARAWLKYKLLHSSLSKIVIYPFVKLFLVVLKTLIYLLTRERKKQRILIVPEYSTDGGTYTYLLQIISYLCENNKYELGICVDKDAEIAGELKEYIEKYNIGVFYKEKRGARYLFFSRIRSLYGLIYDVFSVLRAVREFNPEVIISSVGTVGQYVNLFLYTHSQIHILHTYPLENLNLVSRWVLLHRNTRQKVLTVSKYAKDQIDVYWGLGDKNSINAEYIYNFAEPTISVPQDHDKTIRRSLLVLTAGHVVSYKNPKQWIRVAEKVREILPEVVFCWVGDGDLREECILEVSKDPNIQFIGKLLREELWKKMLTATVYFQPSSVESFGLVVVEAMALKLPCVVNEAGGLPEVVDHGNAGLLVNVHDVASTASTIVGLLKDDNNRRHIQQAGYSFYSNNFTYKVWKARMDALMLTITNSNKNNHVI